MPTTQSTAEIACDIIWKSGAIPFLEKLELMKYVQTYGGAQKGKPAKPRAASNPAARKPRNQRAKSTTPEWKPTDFQKMLFDQIPADRSGIASASLSLGAGKTGRSLGPAIRGLVKKGWVTNRNGVLFRTEEYRAAA